MISNVTPRLAAATPAPAPAPAPNPGDAPAPTPTPAPTLSPLQDRTPAQLQDGLRIKVTGGSGPDQPYLARLMQDAADWKATQEDTTPSLGSVKLHDKWGDRLANPPYTWVEKLPVIGSRIGGGYQAVSEFQGSGPSAGHFQISDSQSNVLEAGIAHLRTAPLDTWSEKDRSDFVETNATVLHEMNHLTLKNYDPATIKQWDGDEIGIEEGLAEITGVGEMPQFMHDEYGANMTGLDESLQQTASVYTEYTARLRHLFELAGATTPQQVLDMAHHLTAGVLPDERPQELASMIAKNVSPGTPDPALVNELAAAIPRYSEDRAGLTVMDVVAKLRDGASAAPAGTSGPAGRVPG
jgi:hypothetical protein